jgi:acyl-CoA thioester hydrolase
MHKKIGLAELEDLPITNQQEIPEEYRDVFGHMNVMWYTRLFGYSFDKFGGLFGFDVAYCRANLIGSFALETHIRYLSEVCIAQHITIRSRALGRSEKRIHYIHFMSVDDTGTLAATAEHISAHIDMGTRRMSPMPRDVCARFDDLVARQNQLSWNPPVCGSMKP